MGANANPLKEPDQIPVNYWVVIDAFGVTQAGISLTLQNALQFFPQYQRGQVGNLNADVRLVVGVDGVVCCLLCQSVIMDLDGKKWHDGFGAKWTFGVQVAVVGRPAGDDLFVINYGGAVFTLRAGCHNELHGTGAGDAYGHPLVQLFKEFGKTLDTLLGLCKMIIMIKIRLLLLELVITIAP